MSQVAACPECGQVVDVEPMNPLRAHDVHTPRGVPIAWHVTEHKRPELTDRMGHTGRWLPCDGGGLIVPDSRTRAR